MNIKLKYLFEQHEPLFPSSLQEFDSLFLEPKLVNLSLDKNEKEAVDYLYFTREMIKNEALERKSKFDKLLSTYEKTKYVDSISRYYEISEDYFV